MAWKAARPQIPSIEHMRARESIFVVVSLVAASVVHAAPADDDARDSASRPVALVYRGPAACDGCPETIAQRLRESRHRFRVIYVGPAEKLKITPAVLAGAALYVQPGGGQDIRGAAASIGKRSIEAVRHYVSNGGRYLGICMGAYLAGDPGFGLVAGEFDSEVDRPGSTLHGIADTVTPVVWRGKKRWIYFQDGAMLPAAPGAVVLATYPNRDIAAATYRYGKGRVGLVGPHPEADESWYRQNGLKNPDGIRPDMADDLINATMKP
ncbi:biotin-protein ligase [Burkholderia lata]|uniref:Biotin-protein ligase n=1 Tax=Burkholderia lata (strain ATCC 17760 / DSM 23089 / LMG 22485 / NCIMB 9086 / R18194 / 383) TaxID=482957 RepID=A0A6P2ZYZ4_BURL3|nr:biotin-protein ligase [Burkholderia lata]